MGITSLGEWWAKSIECWCGDAVIFCAAWNADLSWPVLRDVMKSLPYLPPHRGAWSHEPLPWAPQDCPGRASAPGETKHHKSLGIPGFLGITLQDNTQAEGSLPWGTELIMGYSGRFTMEPKVGRWRDQASLGRNKCAKMEREENRGTLLTVCWLVP